MQSVRLIISFAAWKIPHQISYKTGTVSLELWILISICFTKAISVWLVEINETQDFIFLHGPVPTMIILWHYNKTLGTCVNVWIFHHPTSSKLDSKVQREFVSNKWNKGQIKMQISVVIVSYCELCPLMLLHNSTANIHWHDTTGSRNGYNLCPFRNSCWDFELLYKDIWFI